MNPYQKIALKPQSAQWLPFGAIKPAGWIRQQMQRDLEYGFVGHLDELIPDLIQNDDIYSTDRLTNAVRAKNLGVVVQDPEWGVEFLWWNSETQSNWRDGFVRTALLLENSEYIEKVRGYIRHILATQDADGYLGIYSPELRFNFSSENGELWAQASLLRVLLGYFEATGETLVLDAVRAAVEVTRRAYPLGKSHPFAVKNDHGGVCHGLVFTDVLDLLYQLTGQENYLDYALWLYQEYSETNLSAADIRYRNLTDPAYRFQGHGVHTYEHLRPLVTAVYASGNPHLERALAAYLEKLDLCLTPSGAPIGDEVIGGRLADASEIGYEYCSLHELLDSYTHLLQKTGDPRWGDRIEWLLFNAGQGARHPSESAITYLKTDNSYSMTGSLHPDDVLEVQNKQTRYKYSPAHQDVAVCCVPNAGRIYPYYVKSMWLRSPNGLLAALYGACELNTEVNGVAVHISERTNYPFEHEIAFTVNVAQPVLFELAFRKPRWANGFQLQTGGEWHEDQSLIIIRKLWRSGDQVFFRFQAEVKTNHFQADEHFLSYGPLVFVLPLEGQEKEGRKFPLEGFRDLYYFPGNQTTPELHLMSEGSEGNFMPEQHPFEDELPWGTSLTLVGEMFEPSTQRVIPVRMIPIGGSILRRTTFRRA